MSEELTEKEEVYAQKRASGFTKTRAAQIAYPNTANPRQLGYNTEQRERVKNRIVELKHEMLESSGLDFQEQVRRYNELYYIALEQGKLELASKMLARLDTIGGFEAPNTNINVRVGTGENLKSITDDVESDLKKFYHLLPKGTQKETQQ